MTDIKKEIKKKRKSTTEMHEREKET